MKDSARDLVDTVDDFWAKFQNFERFLGGIQFITIVQVWNGDFTHSDVWISIWILDDHESFDKFWFSAGKNLVEDVVVSFTFELVSDSGFFEEIENESKKKKMRKN